MEGHGVAGLGVGSHGVAGLGVGSHGVAGKVMLSWCCWSRCW